VTGDSRQRDYIAANVNSDLIYAVRVRSRKGYTNGDRYRLSVSSEVLVVVNMEITVFCGVTPCCLADACRRFGTRRL
jgi:hypothetical protein